MSKDKKYPNIFSPQMETIVFIILQIFYATRAVLKIGVYINNSFHLARKYARIFVRGHYLFREANSFQFFREHSSRKRPYVLPKREED